MKSSTLNPEYWFPCGQVFYLKYGLTQFNFYYDALVQTKGVKNWPNRLKSKSCLELDGFKNKNSTEVLIII